MKLRSIAAVAVSLYGLAARPRSASFNPVAIRVSNPTADAGPFAFLGQNSTSQVFYGYASGGYYDFLRRPGLCRIRRARVRLARQQCHAEELPGGRARLRKPFRRPFKPYARFSFGVSTTKAPASTIHVSKFDYALYGGVDYHPQKHIDFRVLEIGYGSVTTVSTADVGGGGTLTSPRPTR